jgi:hypothetical protein
MLLKDISKVELVKLVVKNTGITKTSASKMKQTDLVKLLQKSGKTAKKVSKKKSPKKRDCVNINLIQTPERKKTVKKTRKPKTKDLEKLLVELTERKISKKKTTKKVCKKCPRRDTAKEKFIQTLDLKSMGLSLVSARKLTVAELQNLVASKPIEKKKKVVPKKMEEISDTSDISESDISDTSDISESEIEEKKPKIIPVIQEKISQMVKKISPSVSPKIKITPKVESPKVIERIRVVKEIQTPDLSVINSTIETILIRLDAIESRLNKEKPELETKISQKLEQIKAQVLQMIPPDFKENILTKISELANKVKSDENFQKALPVVKTIAEPIVQAKLTEMIKPKPVSVPVTIPVAKKVSDDEIKMKSKLDEIFGINNWKLEANLNKDNLDRFPTLYSSTLPRKELEYFFKKINVDMKIAKDGKFEKKGYPVKIGWNQNNVFFEFEDADKKQDFEMTVSKFLSFNENTGILSILNIFRK